VTSRGGRWPQGWRQDRFPATQPDFAQSRMRPSLDRSCRRLSRVVSPPPAPALPGRPCCVGSAPRTSVRSATSSAELAPSERPGKAQAQQRAVPLAIMVSGQSAIIWPIRSAVAGALQAAKSAQSLWYARRVASAFSSVRVGHRGVDLGRGQGAGQRRAEGGSSHARRGSDGSGKGSYPTHHA
jgi:hypothetical protein